jgi:phosphoribosylformimino-5-aminoimidazole carboxamide ribotide isomerase
MLLLPAIDLMSGEVVRLRQGRAREKTVYPGAPAEWAARWEAAGGDWLHVVDLDAAFGGESTNHDAVCSIVGAVKIPVELGGGMRDEAGIRRALDAGVTRIVIGTAAVESLGFVREMARIFGGARIAVGIDAQGGLVAVRGWTQSSSRLALELAREVAALGVGTVIYTDIATDGMMTGPNYAALDEMLASVDCAVIASGGVSSNDDLRELAKRGKLAGTIIGRALYDGAVDLRKFRQWPR